MTSYELWSVLGAWFGAAGTIASVIVALYLASKNNRINLKVYLNIVVVTPNINKKYLAFQIINSGLLPVTINSISWHAYKKVNFIAKYLFISNFIFEKILHRFIYKDLFSCLQTFKGEFTANLPKTVKYGESCIFTYPLLDATPIEDMFIKINKEANIKTLYAVVHTSIGKRIYIKPINKDVLELIDKCSE